MQVQVECAPMNAKLTVRGCTTNKLVCKVAIIQVLEGISPFLLGKQELDRLFWCGKCKKFLDGDDVKYGMDRRVYNDQALDVGGMGIEGAQDVIEVVEEGIFRNLMKIERMDMDKGDWESRKYRRRERRREKEKEERIRAAIECWLQPNAGGQEGGGGGGGNR